MKYTKETEFHFTFELGAMVYVGKKQYRTTVRTYIKRKKEINKRRLKGKRL